MVVTAVESLLSVDIGGNTKKFARRLTALLSQTGNEQAFYDEAKDAYQLRCKLVHGDTYSAFSARVPTIGESLMSWYRRLVVALVDKGHLDEVNEHGRCTTFVQSLDASIAGRVQE